MDSPPRMRKWFLIATVLSCIAIVRLPHSTTAIPTGNDTISRQPIHLTLSTDSGTVYTIDRIRNSGSATSRTRKRSRHVDDISLPQRDAYQLSKRATPAGMPSTCKSDFDCLQTSRPSGWPREHATVQSGNYACVFGPGATAAAGTGTCQFVVSAGKRKKRKGKGPWRFLRRPVLCVSRSTDPLSFLPTYPLLQPGRTSLALLLHPSSSLPLGGKGTERGQSKWKGRRAALATQTNKG